MKQWIVFTGIAIVLIVCGGVALVLFQQNPVQLPQDPFFTSVQTPKAQPSLVVTELPNAKTPLPTSSSKRITAQDIPDVHANFKFAAEMPSLWQVESISASQALALFDPNTPGSSNLEKSQIFIRFFSANQFLTLSTVTIYDRTSLQINGRPAVRYDIAKKPSVPSFPAQPSWRNERHLVTDIRVSDSNPSIFYVIAKRPDLDEKIYEQFLQSLRVTDAQTSAVVAPIADFQERITKKPFGIFITPKNSPVQPEKFTGFHTGADVEYTDVAQDVPVMAITDGTVMLSKQASGYGGVVAIKHSIQGKEVVAIYGHLDPASLPKTEIRVKKGQKIGILGDGGTPETDGERKHLHFGIHIGDSVDIRGYVQGEKELSGWLNPLEVIE